MFSDSLNQIAERHPLWILVLVLRVPLMVAAGYILMVSDFAVEDVAFEAVRFVVLDRPFQLYLIAPLLLLAGIGMRFCGETMIDLVAPALRHVGGISGFIVWALPGLLAALIGISTGAQFVNIATDETNFGTPDGGFLGWYEPAAIAGVGYALVGVLTGALPTRWVVSIGGGFSAVDRFLNSSTLTHAIAFALLAMAVAAFFLFADWTNPAPAHYVGSFGVIALWAFAAVMYFSPLALLAHLIRIPVLLLLTIAAFTFSAFNLNDNHEFRTTAAQIGEDNKTYFQRDLSLEEWLRAREKIDLYNYENYPIFIIATEGGGLRAAYLTNRLLESLQTICPAFALHTIAISGVSGGSVGATSFVAQTTDQLVPPDPNKPCNILMQKDADQPRLNPQLNDDRTDKPYDEDHLATLLAGALFPDALQRIVPWPIPGFDRARAIECSFEQALGEVTTRIQNPCSAVSTPLGSIYGGASGPLPPYLFLNTTSVSTGVPVPVATSKIRYRRIDSVDIKGNNTDASVQSILNGIYPGRDKDLTQPIDLPATTAAFLSARFPYVLPPATLVPVDDDRIPTARLLDGGLYENSGTWFAEQVARNLAEQVGSTGSNQDPQFRKALKSVRFHLVVIRGTPCRKTNPLIALFLDECSENIAPDRRSASLIELGSPPQALLSTRIARGYDAQRSLTDFAAGSKGRLTITELRFLNETPARIPLTWTLSQASRSVLDDAAAKISDDLGSTRSTRDEDLKLIDTMTDSDTPFRLILCTLHQQIAAPSLGEYCPKQQAPKEDCPAPAQRTPVEPPTPLVQDRPIKIEEDEQRKIKDRLPALPELDRCENCAPKKP